jgi:predicted DNA-binding ribbon-helix-helix protein
MKRVWLGCVFTISLSAIAQTPTPTCQSLAGRYAQDPAKMTDTELASLRTCVSDLLKLRQQPLNVDSSRKKMPMANNPSPLDAEKQRLLSKDKGVIG